MEPRWNLSVIPPQGHPDVAEFAYSLFELSRQEMDRLNKRQSFLANFFLYKGHQPGPVASTRGVKRKRKKALINLYFSNVERTSANITARQHAGEVIDVDGYNDEAEQLFSMKLQKWWKDTDQHIKMRNSSKPMEIYGITIEKPVRDPDTNVPNILVTDPFNFFPAPGNWEDIAVDAPYICYAYPAYTSEIERMYGTKDIAHEDTYDLFGRQREEVKTQLDSPQVVSYGNYKDPMVPVRSQDSQLSDKKIEQGIIIELWIRDHRTKKIRSEEPFVDELGAQVVVNGKPQVIVSTKEVKVYPDGIRKITISRSKDPNDICGWKVVDDSKNPNINHRHLLQGTSLLRTYTWGKLPCYIANSYKDGITIWGFSAAEQTGDLIEKINLIVTKLVDYAIQAMTPTLIVQKNCGITREMIESNKGRKVLMPSIPNARIEYLQTPNLPASFFQVLDLILKLFDRVYQIEDADRGVVPTGVVAASAIVALQERNQVLMQTKKTSVEYLAEQRSKWFIGFSQNFGVEEDSVEVGGEMRKFRPVNYVGRTFNYVVESGSTMPRTSLQLQEMAKWLYQLKAISQKGLLQVLNWPGWRDEVARTAETQLGMALQVLVDSGLPEEAAIQIQEMLKTIRLQAESDKTNTGGVQPVQPKSLVPPSSNVQTGA